jgi:hypothetical protein
MNESNSQRKKRLAREFNEAKAQAVIDREKRAVERVAFERTPEGKSERYESERRRALLMSLPLILSMR